MASRLVAAMIRARCISMTIFFSPCPGNLKLPLFDRRKLYSNMNAILCCQELSDCEEASSSPSLLTLAPK